MAKKNGEPQLKARASLVFWGTTESNRERAPDPAVFPTTPPGMIYH